MAEALAGYIPFADLARRDHADLRRKEILQSDSVRWRTIPTYQHRERRAAVRWMTKVCGRAEIPDLTLHTAVSVFDSFTERTNAIGSTIYRLPALASILIAGLFDKCRQKDVI
jgi:hypothetical protein